MNSTIREAVESTILEQIGRVPMGYQRVVEAVVTKMEGLAEEAANSIRESAEGRVDSEQVEAALVAAGLVEPEPVTETATTSTDEDRLSKIEAAVQRLEALAERYIGRR